MGDVQARILIWPKKIGVICHGGELPRPADLGDDILLANRVGQDNLRVLRRATDGRNPEIKLFN
jgi:hypothetical protein